MGEYQKLTDAQLHLALSHPDTRWMISVREHICAIEADLARLREDIRNVEAERDQIVALMREERDQWQEIHRGCPAELTKTRQDRDALAVENRRMWGAIKTAIECNRKKTGDDAICPLCHSDLDVGCIEGCPAMAGSTPHTAREVERVNVLGAMVRMFADRRCGAGGNNSNCEIETKAGRLERKCYSCEAREALAALDKLK